MLDPQDFNAKVERLEQRLQTKLGLRGATLSARLRRAGRTLPRYLQKEGAVLLGYQKKIGHPKLAMQSDTTRVIKAFDAFESYLKGIDPKDRRKGKVLGWLGGLVFNLLVLAAVVAALFYWQGSV